MATTVANRAIKARAKASPDRIQQDICNERYIKAGKIHPNDVMHLAENDEREVAQLPEGNISVPLSLWLAHKEQILSRGGTITVQIAADEAAEDLAEDLPKIDMIILPFVNFVDGRAYSNAHKLRVRYGYQGEIRAVGDVNFDQLAFLARVGVDAFELREGADYETALRAFEEFSEVYQPAADGARLIFSRRRKVH